jgi:hypothetical protein
MFEVAIYYCETLINIVSVGHPCLIDFIKKVPRECNLFCVNSLDQ